MPRILVLHPSDELYGADRVILEVVKSIAHNHDIWEVEVWIPDDINYEDAVLLRSSSCKAARFGRLRFRSYAASIFQFVGVHGY